MNTSTKIKWWAVALPVFLAACATGGTGGGKLELADEGSFFVNGQSYRSEYPGASLNTGPAPAGNITVNQMYVQGGSTRTCADPTRGMSDEG